MALFEPIQNVKDFLSERFSKGLAGTGVGAFDVTGITKSQDYRDANDKIEGFATEIRQGITRELGLRGAYIGEKLGVTKERGIPALPESQKETWVGDFTEWLYGTKDAFTVETEYGPLAEFSQKIPGVRNIPGIDNPTVLMFGFLGLDAIPGGGRAGREFAKQAAKTTSRREIAEIAARYSLKLGDDTLESIRKLNDPEQIFRLTKSIDAASRLTEPVVKRVVEQTDATVAAARKIASEASGSSAAVRQLAKFDKQINTLQQTYNDLVRPFADSNGLINQKKVPVEVAKASDLVKEQITKLDTAAKVLRTGKDIAPDVVRATDQLTPQEIARQKVKLTKERTLPKSADEAGLASEMAKIRQKDTLYEVSQTKEITRMARDIVRKDFDEAGNFIRKELGNWEGFVDWAKSPFQVSERALQQATGFEYANKLHQLEKAATLDGNTKLAIKYADEAADILDILSVRATDYGQATQINALLSNTSWAGGRRFMEKLVKKYNDILPSGRKIELTKEQWRIVDGFMDDARLARTDAERSLLTLQAQEVIAKEFRKKLPWWKKIAGAVNKYRYMAMLLNAKTIEKNIFGNMVATMVEYVSNIVATPLDKWAFKQSGFRTTGRLRMFGRTREGKRSLRTTDDEVQGWLSAGWEGAVQAWKEIMRGVDSVDSAKKYNLPKNKFDSKVGRFFEKILNVGLRVPDRFVYNAHMQAELANLQRLNKTKELTPAMEDLASTIASTRNYTNSGKMAELFEGIRNLGNIAYLGPKGYGMGLGDLIIPFAKTSANLVTFGLSFTPLAFIRTASLLHILGKSKIDDIGAVSATRMAQQADLVRSASRGIIGTGIMGVGYQLRDMGIITSSYNRDISDVEATRQQLGSQNNAINLDALQRLLTGDNPAPRADDTLVDFDWMLPLSIPLIIGSDLKDAEGRGINITDILEVLGDFVGTAEAVITDQSLLQSLRKFNYSTSILEGLQRVLRDVPASFVPAIVNQLRQVTDLYRRGLDDRSLNAYVVDSILNRLPFFSSTLPVSPNAMGEMQFIMWDQDQKRWYENAWNAFINPSKVTKLDPQQPELELLKLYMSTGESKHLPRYVMKDKTMRINNKTYSLSPEVRAQMQVYLGTEFEKDVKALISSREFMNVNDEEKVKMVYRIRSDIYTAAKIIFLENGTIEKGTSRRVLQRVRDFEGMRKQFTNKLKQEYGL